MQNIFNYSWHLIDDLILLTYNLLIMFHIHRVEVCQEGGWSCMEDCDCVLFEAQDRNYER